MPNKDWMIYGAYGYSGRLIAEEAKAQGLTPILAGRNGEKTRALAEQLGFAHVSFDLEEVDIAQKYLKDMALVLHCAGPFSQTAKPMLEACLEAGAHYLDITGEIDVFCLAHELDPKAKAAEIVLCPGVGFDVIPTDCVALSLKNAMPDATHLALGFDSRSGFSRGTARTAVEGLAHGGRIRKAGVLTRVPLAYRDRRIDFGAGEKLAMTIPWGDVATAYFTTEIPNIEVYIPASPSMLKKTRRLRLVQPMLKWGFVQKILKGQVDKKTTGPNEQTRAKATTYVWGEVRNAAGDIKQARLHTANGYEITKTGSIAMVKHLLENKTASGYATPSQLMGPSFICQLPGSGKIEITNG